MTAHSVIMRRFAEEPVWRENGLSMREYDVLYTLAKCEAPARLGELQQGVLLSQPALSRLVDRLEARGLVARSSDQTDGRAVRVTLTPAGKELQQTVGPVSYTHLDVYKRQTLHGGTTTLAQASSQLSGGLTELNDGTAQLGRLARELRGSVVQMCIRDRGTCVRATPQHATSQR